MSFIGKMNDYFNRPNKINTIATMNVEIKKGEKKGVAWIPCSFETISYGIDVNPSLIKKKTGKKIKDLSLDETFTYHPGTEELKLKKDEQVQLEEVSRCPHCGQKLVISEVCTTKYRSCPLVEITLSDPTSEDVSVPVSFGFNKWQVYQTLGLFGFIFGVGFYAVSELVLSSILSPSILLSSWLNIIMVPLSVFITIFGLSKFSRLVRWLKVTRKIGWKRYKDSYNLRNE